MWKLFRRRSRAINLRHLEHKVDTLMSSFEDLLSLQAATATLVASVKTEVDQLKAAPPAGLTTEQQAQLDQAVVTAQSINDQLSAINTPAPV